MTTGKEVMAEGLWKKKEKVW